MGAVTKVVAYNPSSSTTYKLYFGISHVFVTFLCSTPNVADNGTGYAGVFVFSHLKEMVAFGFPNGVFNCTSIEACMLKGLGACAETVAMTEMPNETMLALNSAFPYNMIEPLA